jgi:HrpA-like RNA helicase
MWTFSQQCRADDDQITMIGVTEPRRIAATSISRRVAQELNLSDKEVSYQVCVSVWADSNESKARSGTRAQ